MNNYEKILESMKNRYKELTGNAVKDMSDTDVRMKVLAGEIYKEQVNLEFIKNQMFVQTATGEYLDYHAMERGLERKSGLKATGEVNFRIAEAMETDLIIPQGTVVSTDDENPVRFYTDRKMVIEAGRTYVTVSCTAEKEGKAGNVSANAVKVLITTVPGVSEVVNNNAFTGGSDDENDSHLRQRVIDTFRDVSTGTNAAYYKKLALSVPGITGVGILKQGLGIGSVGVYINSNGKRATAQQILQVQRVLDEARELNVEIRVVSATETPASFHIYISVEDGYEFEEVAERVKQAIRDYIDLLEISESVYSTHIGKVVLDVAGVKNYGFGTFYDNQYIVSTGGFIRLENVLIEELGE